MSVYGIAGTIEDEQDLIKGNGKTNTCVFFGASAYCTGRRVIANIKTSFSESMRIDEMIKNITYDIIHCKKANLPLQKSEYWNVVLLMDELDKFLNSLGSSAYVVNFVDRMVSQIRKINGDLYHTEQRWDNLHRRMRLQTDQILKPKKRHYSPPYGNGHYCYVDKCEEPHAIEVWSYYPPSNEPLIVLDAATVGKWYNSWEFVADLPNIKEIKAIMKGEVEG
jgi:hypothetical protein